jgi:DNA/RNA endonuclease G (NUC1)
MKKKSSRSSKILLLIVLIALSAVATLFKKPKLLPQSEILIERDAYALAYDGQHRQPRWVYERLTAESIQGEADRKQFDFQEDDLIPEPLRSKRGDYAGSGFDRGHLCPAADARFSKEAMRETFYLSNISPQCAELNRGYWAKLERHVRDLTRHYKAIHVFTGALYLPIVENGKRYVKYQVIGENDVAVPTHFFKVMFCEKNGIPEMKAYILPNQPISSQKELSSFETTVEKVEKMAGIVFPRGEF